MRRFLILAAITVLCSGLGHATADEAKQLDVKPSTVGDDLPPPLPPLPAAKGLGALVVHPPQHAPVASPASCQSCGTGGCANRCESSYRTSRPRGVILQRLRDWLSYCPGPYCCQRPRCEPCCTPHPYEFFQHRCAAGPGFGGDIATPIAGCAACHGCGGKNPCGKCSDCKGRK